MEKSQSIKEIATSLSQFQAKVEAIKKDANNPFFKSKYAPLESIIAAIRQPLEEVGLSFSQFPSGENELVTILMHKSGEYLQSSVKMTPKKDSDPQMIDGVKVFTQVSPQAQGSAITYMRRYSLSAVLGLATEDDDGNAASKHKPVEKKEDTKKVFTSLEDIKKSIAARLSKLGINYKELTPEESKQMFIDKTQLEPTDNNFIEINNRLGVLVSDKEEASKKNNG